MRNLTKTYFKVMQIVALVMAILFCISIIGIIFAIPLFIASKRFKAGHNCSSGDKDAELIQKRGNLLAWGIVMAILLCATIIGMIAIIILAIMVNNFIKDLEMGNVDKANRSFSQVAKDGVGAVKDTLGFKSDAEKLRDQLNTLKGLRDDGIITEEEYQIKRKNLIEKV